MKSALKVVGGIVGVLLLAVAAFAAYVNATGIPSYPVEKVEFKVTATPEKIKEGKRFVSMLCAECHMNKELGVLAGRQMTDLPPEFGSVWVRNITQDKLHGIGEWTDAQIAYLIRTGIKRDGRYAPPWMAKLPHMSDDELESIIAFLRSDDPWVKATPVPDRDAEPTFLTKLLVNTVMKPLPWPKEKKLRPPATDRAALGKYLVSALDCYQCHSADFKTVNIMEIEKSEGFMAGGNMVMNYDGSPAYPANLTPDPETGIGKWSEAEFVRAVRGGLRPDNSLVRPPMPLLSELTEDEAGAIYTYLKTIPPIKKERRQWSQPVAAPASSDEGARLYHKYACFACHGERGVGMCDLTKAGQKYPEDEKLIAWIKDPQKIVPDSKMPKWEGVIPEADFAPIAKFIRSLGAGPAK